MLNEIGINVGGWTVVGVMLASGLVLGTISDRLLRFVGVRDRIDRS